MQVFNGVKYTIQLTAVLKNEDYFHPLPFLALCPVVQVVLNDYTKNMTDGSKCGTLVKSFLIQSSKAGF